MQEIIERIVYILLGAVVGYVLGVIIHSLGLSYLKDVNDKYYILIITSLIGFIVSTFITEYRKSKVAQKSNKVRNEAIALITHEMRTGLTSTGWAIQMTLEKYGSIMSAEDKSTLEMVFDSIHATVMHSVNLLDISIIDINKLSISLQWVTLAIIEKEFIEILKEYVMGAEKNGITLTYQVKLDKEKQIEVDIIRLKIILRNLLENSIQYTLGDKKLIEVQIDNTDKNLNIKVSDTGIGIPLAEQKKIFEEFYRASNARAKLSTGSGIGLYMCNEYTKAHKGTIKFESKEKEGTTFFVTIPLNTKEDIEKLLEKI